MGWLKALAVSTLAIFAPIKSVILAALAICLIDTILGVWAAKKRGEAITSKGFGRTVIKILVFELAILCGFVVQKYLISDQIQLANIIGGLIGTTELMSVLENIDSISGGSIFQSIINTLGSQSNKGP